MTASDIRDLYQQVILDHNRKPRNFGALDAASHSAEGYNPICGDHYHVRLLLDAQGLIADLRFEGQGCAISKSSASMMTAAVKGRSEPEARQLAAQFLKLLKGELRPEAAENSFDKLNVFAGIWEYPARVKCAALAWYTMVNALDRNGRVSTE